MVSHRVADVQPIHSHLQSDMLPLDTGLPYRRNFVFARPKAFVSNKTEAVYIVLNYYYLHIREKYFKKYLPTGLLYNIYGLI